MSKLIYGAGVNDADYVVVKNESFYVDGKRKQKAIWRCPFYLKWQAMIQRCYSEKYQREKPTYIGCSVTEEWHTFSNFKKWMEQQEWEGKHLDKDILVPGNKVYSPDTCVFVDGAVNVFLVDRGSAGGDWPLGVCFRGDINKFRSQCSNPFTKQREYLGYFKDPQEAHLAWKQRKHELACQLADLQTDQRVADALRARYL